jgi:hypothetical protein
LATHTPKNGVLINFKYKLFQVCCVGDSLQHRTGSPNETITSIKVLLSLTEDAFNSAKKNENKGQVKL